MAFTVAANGCQQEPRTAMKKNLLWLEEGPGLCEHNDGAHTNTNHSLDQINLPKKVGQTPGEGCRKGVTEYYKVPGFWWNV